MRLYVVTGAISFLLTLSVVVTASIAEDERPSGHRFECGDAEPPSGTYLDFDTGVAMDYDCESSLLTPIDSMSGFCKYAGDGEGMFVPLHGFCIGTNLVDCGGEWCDSVYEVKSLVAAKNQWSYSWKTFYLEGLGGELKSCDEAACYGPVYMNPCVSNDLVTYCKDGTKHYPVCPGHEITVKSELKAKADGQPGSATFEGVQDVATCL